MNRRVIFPLLFLLVVVALQGCGFPFIRYPSNASDLNYFEDDLSNAYYAKADDLLRETRWTTNKAKITILHQQMIEEYDKIMEIHPNHPLILFKRGTVYTGLGEYEEAIEDYDAFLLTSPNDGMALENRGRTYELNGDLERAYEDYKLVQLDLERLVHREKSSGLGSIYKKHLLRINKKVEELEDALTQQNKPIPEAKIPVVESSRGSSGES